MNTYPSYKDSGVEWIGDIPSGWKQLKIKNLFNFSKGKGLSKSSIEDEGSHNCVLYGELFTAYKNQTTLNNIVSKTNSVVDVKSSGNELLIPGSTTTTGVDLSNCKFLPIENVLLGGDIVILKPSNYEIKQTYYSYFLTYVSTPEFITGSRGVTIYHIYATQIREISTALPTLQEQQQISDYLNYKTSKIDTLIEKTKQKIELLKEQRISLINTAVTKGLNPNVEMKDSGIEWIGKVPSGWDVKPLKYFAKITLGKMLTPNDKGGYLLKPYLRSANVQSEIPNLNDVREMWFSEKELNKYILIKGDLLVSEGGDAGRTSIWNNELPEVYIQNSVNRVDIKNGVKKYYLYHFILNHKTGYFDSIVNRVSIPHLTKDKLVVVKFVCPPLQEQQQIVKYLDKETSKIDTLINKESKRIALLKEYRQSLISDVVTGKVDVRNEVLV